MIYLDHNATTKVDSRVYKAMKPYFEEEFGNPSSSHKLGVAAKRAVDDARNKVATMIKALPSEILFTSCGSEANNMVLKGVANTNRQKGNHIITSVIEHPSILKPLQFLENQGMEVTRVLVDEFGMVNPLDIQAAIKDTTILVSIMHANNETGTIQPIKEIGEICKKHDILFHTDASQSLGKVIIDVQDLGVDFLTIAGHKMYAPKGIGALYIKENKEIQPLIHGANHEFGLRAGTLNVPYIVGLGKAAELVTAETIQTELRDYFEQNLLRAFDNIKRNGHPLKRLPNTSNLSFLGFNGTEILEKMSEVAASTGSACHEGSFSNSPVLSSMGCDQSTMSGAIRFSLGRYTSKDELDEVLKLLTKILAQSHPDKQEKFVG